MAWRGVRLQMSLPKRNFFVFIEVFVGTFGTGAARNRNAAAELVAQQPRAGDVVGVHVRLERPRELHAELVGALQDDAQERRRADVAARLQVGDRRHLLLGLPDPAGENRAADRMRAGFEHRPRRREVIREAVVDEVAGPKPGREERAREPPVIGGRAFGLVDRPGRREDAACASPARRRQAAERTRLLLQRRELRLAHDGQPCERVARGDRRRIHVRERARERRRMRLRVRDPPRDLRELLALPQRGIARLERVVMLGHRRSVTRATSCGGGSA